MKAAWLKFWFNDYTRILGVVFGGHLLVTGPLVHLILCVNGLPEYTSGAMASLYLAVFGWALLDNDYSKVEKL